MNRKTTFFLIVTLVTLLALPGAALAQYAATQPWTSTIYYFNPAEDSGELQVTYFNTLSTDPPLASSNIPVGAHQAGEVYIGDTGIAPGFKGSAMLSASVPVLAVYEQAASGTDPNYGRLLYTAFEATQGATKVYIPSFIIDPKSYQTQVGIQPINGTDTVDVKITLYDSAGNQAAEIERDDIVINESLIFDSRDTTSFPELVPLTTNPFNGSAVIEVVGSGAIVAAAEEMQTNGRRAYAYEGIAETGPTVYIPNGSCRYSTGGQTTTLSIQNAGNVDTTVEITAFAENVTAARQLGKYTLPTVIKPGGRVSIGACSIPGVSTRSASLVVHSLNETPLAVVGKISASTGLMTAFTGKTSPSEVGRAQNIVLPYVNWAANPNKGYRAYISVMNVSGQPATTVTATFYDRTGFSRTVNLGAIPPNTKRTFNPSSVKALKPDQSFKGAVQITSDKDILVIVRLEKKLTGVTGYTVFGEEYLGIPYIATP